MQENSSAWGTAVKSLEEAAKLANLNQDVLNILKEHQRIFITTFSVRMDDGSLKIFKGYRVHHNHALGPIRGGTRFHKEETLDDMKALSLWMTVKNALNGIPAGGGKGGVVCDPEAMSEGELQRLCRAYIRAIAPVIGSWIDFPGADVGTSSKTMSWMMDEWEQMHAMTHEPTAISGKEIVIGGSEGRPAATGYGVCLTVRETCKALGLDINQQRVAIQGFGKVGSWAARLIFDMGAKIVAVGDVFSGVTNENGINPYELLEHVEKTGKVQGFAGTSPITNEELLTCECDVLIPAATQSVITADNAAKVTAKIVVEGANGPTTTEAEKILASKGVFLIPDILANGGGTTIAHLERVQCLCDDFWTEEQVNNRYEGMFIKACQEVFDIAKKENISIRMAAWVKALRIVEKAIVARGWV
ncbi:MAG: hypothetical protein VR67_06825 [Peptococcaceae bacterium BRH_c8a]|nr:MAG: hypothetical protein VR67_06825 [Peptococcaceae bacterium BRH_c8a]